MKTVRELLEEADQLIGGAIELVDKREDAQLSQPLEALRNENILQTLHLAKDLIQAAKNVEN